MIKRYLVIIAALSIVLGGCVFNINLVPGPQPLMEKVIEGSGEKKILLVDISGLITAEEKRSGFSSGGPSMVSRIREELALASEDKEIVAVVLRINTPGGTVSASDAIYNEVMRYRERTGVKVYSSIVGVGTSGGYYVASATDRIYAQPASVTGSIGVIAVNMEFSGLMKKLGVTDKTYRSGDMKGMLSPFRPDSAEEARVIQGIIDSMHKRFASVVSEGRKGKLTPAEVGVLADGRPYIAEDALLNGLVDAIGYPEDVMDAIKDEQGLADALVVAYQRPGTYRGTIYSLSNVSGNTLVNISGGFEQPGVRFMYIWPGE